MKMKTDPLPLRVRPKDREGNGARELTTALPSSSVLHRIFPISNGYRRRTRTMNCNISIDSMSAVNTRLLVADYLKYRLEQRGLEWQECPAGLPTPGRVQLTLRTLGDEFEQRYTEVFEEMCNQLHITPNTAHPTFVAIVNELFSDGVKWGRVVALFAFGGSLAVQCCEREMPLLLDQIVDWISDYVDNHLQSWIVENGGWVGTDFIYIFHPM